MEILQSQKCNGVKRGQELKAGLQLYTDAVKLKPNDVNAHLGTPDAQTTSRSRGRFLLTAKPGTLGHYSWSLPVHGTLLLGRKVDVLDNT